MHLRHARAYARHQLIEPDCCEANSARSKALHALFQNWHTACHMRIERAQRKGSLATARMQRPAAAAAFPTGSYLVVFSFKLSSIQALSGES